MKFVGFPCLTLRMSLRFGRVHTAKHAVRLHPSPLRFGAAFDCVVHSVQPFTSATHTALRHNTHSTEADCVWMCCMRQYRIINMLTVWHQ